MLWLKALSAFRLNCFCDKCCLISKYLIDASKIMAKYLKLRVKLAKKEE